MRTSGNTGDCARERRRRRRHESHLPRVIVRADDALPADDEQNQDDALTQLVLDVTGGGAGGGLLDASAVGDAAAAGATQLYTHAQHALSQLAVSQEVEHVAVLHRDGVNTETQPII